MSLAARLARVQQAEQAASAAHAQAGLQWRALGACWRSSWTPGRIVVIGLAAGFAVGQARPLRLAGGTLWPLLRTLSPLLGDAFATLAKTATAAAAPPSAQAADTDA